MLRTFNPAKQAARAVTRAEDKALRSAALRSALFVSRGRMASMDPVDDLVRAQPKTEVVRSEPYRRAVAQLACKVCGIAGYSQAAHPPPSGKSVKEDDRLCWPACCTRVGILGCHASFDQYKLMPRSAAVIYAHAAAADTRRQITAMGLWPANLPVWKETP